MIPGDVWLVPEFGRVLDKLDVEPALWTSICRKKKKKHKTKRKHELCVFNDWPKEIKECLDLSMHLLGSIRLFHVTRADSKTNTKHRNRWSKTFYVLYDKKMLCRVTSATSVQTGVFRNQSFDSSCGCNL